MAIIATNLTSGNDSTGSTTSFTTASISPTANKLILLGVTIRNGSSTNPADPTSVTGCGLTWELIDSHVVDSSSSSRRRQCLYRALGSSPSSGTVTINLAETDTGGVWIIDELSNIDTTGTNGSGAIVQVAKNVDETLSISTLTVTLSAFSNSNNATYAYFSNTDGTQTTTAGTGFTKIGDNNSTDANSSHRFTSEFRSDNDTTVDMTFSAVEAIAGIAVEIKAYVPPAGTITGLSSVTTTAPSISAVNLKSENNLPSASGTSYTVSSITPSPNKLILLAVDSRTNITADPNQPTVTGCSLTWVAINSIIYDTTSASRKRITLFRALGASPTSGTLTIDFAGQTQTNCNWIVDEISGIDTSGTNGSGAIVQSATNKDETGTVSSLTVTLGAFSRTENATYGAFDFSDVDSPQTQGSGFTLLASNGQTATSDPIGTEFKSTNDTTVDMSASGNSQCGGIAIEIKNAFPSAMVWVV